MGRSDVAKKWPKTADKRESNTCNIDLNVILIASEPHVCATNLTSPFIFKEGNMKFLSMALSNNGTL